MALHRGARLLVLAALVIATSFTAGLAKPASADAGAAPTTASLRKNVTIAIPATWDIVPDANIEEITAKLAGRAVVVYDANRGDDTLLVLAAAPDPESDRGVDDIVAAIKAGTMAPTVVGDRTVSDFRLERLCGYDGYSAVTYDKRRKSYYTTFHVKVPGMPLVTAEYDGKTDDEALKVLRSLCVTSP
jgi:hypothetical protein